MVLENVWRIVGEWRAVICRAFGRKSADLQAGSKSPLRFVGSNQTTTDPSSQTFSPTVETMMMLEQGGVNY